MGQVDCKEMVSVENKELDALFRIESMHQSSNISNVVNEDHNNENNFVQYQEEIIQKIAPDQQNNLMQENFKQNIEKQAGAEPKKVTLRASKKNTNTNNKNNTRKYSKKLKEIAVESSEEVRKSVYTKEKIERLKQVELWKEGENKNKRDDRDYPPIKAGQDYTMKDLFDPFWKKRLERQTVYDKNLKEKFLEEQKNEPMLTREEELEKEYERYKEVKLRMDNLERQTQIRINQEEFELPEIIPKDEENKVAEIKKENNINAYNNLQMEYNFGIDVSRNKVENKGIDFEQQMKIWQKKQLEREKAQAEERKREKVALMNQLQQQKEEGERRLTELENKHRESEEKLKEEFRKQMEENERNSKIYFENQQRERESALLRQLEEKFQKSNEEASEQITSNQQALESESNERLKQSKGSNNNASISMKTSEQKSVKKPLQEIKEEVPNVINVRGQKNSSTNKNTNHEEFIGYTNGIQVNVKDSKSKIRKSKKKPGNNNFSGQGENKNKCEIKFNKERKESDENINENEDGDDGYVE